MGGIFINKKLFFIGKKSSPHHPITPSPHQPRQFLTENETALPLKGGGRRRGDGVGGDQLDAAS
jgi:hypothetical protein